MRSAGMRGQYESYFEPLKALKEGILFEMGFDRTTPFKILDISSWAFDKILELGIKVLDNRALRVRCIVQNILYLVSNTGAADRDA